MEETARQLRISPQKTINYLSEIGNSSAATIPIAWSMAVENQQIRKGQHLLLSAVGAGISAGSVVFSGDTNAHPNLVKLANGYAGNGDHPI